MSDSLSGRWIPYIRVSTDEQKRSNLSLPNQLAHCQQWASDHGVTLLEAIEAGGESGYGVDRPSIDRLLAAVRRERAAGVIVYKANRLSRNWEQAGTVASELARLGVQVRSVLEGDIDESKDGRRRLGEAVLHGQRESDEKSKQSVSTMRRMAQQGHWLWLAPFGYDNRSPRDGSPSLMPNNRRDVVAEMFERVAAGEEPTRVARSLERRGVLTDSKGRPYDTRRVTAWIRNPLYMARVVIPKWDIDVPGAFEPIVSPELFRQANAALASRRKRRAAIVRTRPEFPLRGIVRCESCGHIMTGSTSRSKTGALHHYYHCSAKNRRRQCKHVRPEALEAAFEKAVRALVPDPAGVAGALGRLTDHVKARQSADAEERRSLERRRAHLQEQRVALGEALISRTMSRDVYRTLDASKSAALAEVERSLRALDSARSVDVPRLLAFSAGLLANLPTVLPALKPETRAMLLAGLFEDVSYDACGTVQTRLRGRIFKQLTADSASDAVLASPPGFEPGFQP